MEYRIKEPTIDKLNEITRLTFNMLLYQKDWNLHFGHDRKTKMLAAQKMVQEWLDKNIEPVEDSSEAKTKDTKKRWAEVRY